MKDVRPTEAQHRSATQQAHVFIADMRKAADERYARCKVTNVFANDNTVGLYIKTKYVANEDRLRLAIEADPRTVSVVALRGILRVIISVNI